MVSSGCSCESRWCALSDIVTSAVDSSSSSKMVTPGCCLRTDDTRSLRRRADGVTRYSFRLYRLPICLESLPLKGFIISSSPPTNGGRPSFPQTLRRRRLWRALPFSLPSTRFERALLHRPLPQINTNDRGVKLCANAVPPGRLLPRSSRGAFRPDERGFMPRAATLPSGRLPLHNAGRIRGVPSGF